MREYGYLFLLIASSEVRGRRILHGCQQAMSVSDRALIAHRYCTRSPAESYEVGLSEAEFMARNEFGCFLLDWRQHDVNFGLGVEVDRWLDGGLNVVALGSSRAIESARLRYRHHLRVVYAPGGKDADRWFTRVTDDKRIHFRQLGLGFEQHEEFDDNVEGLKLDEDIAVAVKQLSGWVQMSEPPALVAA